MSEESTSCCRWCTGFIFSSGLTALFMWLSLRPSAPNLSIDRLFVPALNITVNSTLNTNNNISFGLRLNNPNKDKGIYYDAVNVTLYYGHNLTSPIGNVSIPPFRQGHKKKAYRWVTVEPAAVPLEEAKREVTKNGTTVFRVDVATAVRYKILFWKTRHHRIKVGGDVAVDNQGKKSMKKDKKLSCAPVNVCYCAQTGVLVIFVLILFWF